MASWDSELTSVSFTERIFHCVKNTFSNTLLYYTDMSLHVDRKLKHPLNIFRNIKIKGTFLCLLMLVAKKLVLKSNLGASKPL